METTFSFAAPKLRSGPYEICPAVALGIQENHVNLTWLYGVLQVEYENSDYELAELGLDYEISNTQVGGVSII